jgi:hypothetical protein
LLVFKEDRRTHTLEFDGIKHVLEPFLLEFFINNVNVIGNVVIDPVVFKKKLKV